MSRTPCPLCGVYPPPPPKDFSWEVPDTPYTDECGCSDRGTCLYHAGSLEARPQRPHPDEMAARATKQYVRRMANYQEKMAKFAEYEKLSDWHACAKDALASIQNCCRMALHEGSDKTEMLREIEHIAKRAWEDE